MPAVIVNGIAAAEERAKRILIIGVDAIPYEVVRKLKQPSKGHKAYFKSMTGPIAVINSFPANTDIAWTGLLEPFGIKKPDGYEARYFDRRRRMVIGGTSLIEPHAPWKDFFDWRLKGVITGAVAYGWPQAYSVKELKRGLAAFLRSDKRVFSFYVISTDGVGHIYGPTAQAAFLKILDRQLRQFRRAHPRMKFHTIIVSDHGMAGGKPLKNTWQAVGKSVQDAGYNPSNVLGKRTDIVFIPYGLLSSFIVHTWKGEEDKVAKAIVATRGIDLCATHRKQVWKVHDRHGHAVIKRKKTNDVSWWSYNIVSGDPLNYLPVLRRLRRHSGDHKRSWFRDRWWFAATRRHEYPDALYRIYRSFDLVNNPTSVVCSVSPGHMFGALLTEYAAISTIGRLRWTHGSLRRESSYGFLLHDIPGWPRRDVVRFNEALAPLVGLRSPDKLAGSWRAAPIHRRRR